MEVSNEELINAVGGVSKIAIGVIVGGFITLLVGIVDGFLRPLNCR